MNKISPMTGFEPRTTGIGGDHFTNWATTTTHNNNFCSRKWIKSFATTARYDETKQGFWSCFVILSSNQQHFARLDMQLTHNYLSTWQGVQNGGMLQWKLRIRTMKGVPR